MSVKERIKKYITSKNISNRKFSLSIGKSENYITNMRKSLQPEVIDSIKENYPDLNIEWLLTGEGNMLKEDYQEGDANQLSEAEVIKKIERLEKALDLAYAEIERINTENELLRAQLSTQRKTVS